MDVADVLRRELLSGRWEAGSKLPTWTDMCERFSLGRPTLTRALEILKEERFIVANSTRGTFVADHLPHLHRYPLLFQGRPGEKGHQGWNLFWNALYRAAKKGGFPNGDYFEPVLGANLHIDNVPGQLTQWSARRKSIAGVLVAQGAELIGFPETKDVPVIYIGWDPKDPCRLTVSHDWPLYFRMSVTDVLSRGRKRIAVFSSNLDSMLLAAEEVRRQGGECRDEWCFAMSSDICLESVRNMVHLLLSGASGVRPDGLLVMDDNLVPGALAGIDASGISMPEDLDVVVHCNDAAEAVSRPGVRSLCFPVEKALEAAVALATEARETGVAERHVFLSPEFV